MRDDDWNALGAHWRDRPVHVGDEWLRTIHRRIRRHRIGFYTELATTGFVLGMLLMAVLSGWLSPNGLGAGRSAWYAGAAVLIVLFQVGSLLLRRHHRLLGAPGDGVLAWIDAECSRARYVIAYWWSSMLASMAIVGWAAYTVDALAEPLLAKMLGALTVGGLAFAVVRTVSMRRWLRRLAAQRAALVGEAVG